MVMMTNDNKNTYEAKILETLVKNAERLAVVENTLTGVKSEVKTTNIRVAALSKQVQNLDSRLGIVENEVMTVKNNLNKLDEQLNSKINWLFGAVFGVGASILAALYARPLLTALTN